MVDVPLFYSPFSSRTPVCIENYAVLAILSIVSLTLSIAPSAVPPCLVTTIGVSSKFGALRGKVSSRKNMVLSFEDPLPLGIYILGVSPDGRWALTVA
jgi:hypothetical protein